MKFRISAVIIDNFSNDHYRKNPVCTSRGELYLEEHVANDHNFYIQNENYFIVHHKRFVVANSSFCAREVIMQ